MDPLVIFLKEKFAKRKNINNLTCRKLSTEYYKETGIKISKSTINKVIRHKLGYKFLKTTIKNINILSQDNIITSLEFLKIIERCIKMNIKLIYLDESSILNTNNNYRLWRYPNEEIYMPLAKKEKTNLIMAITDEDVIHYAFNKENTNEKNFSEFINDLNKKIIDKKIGPYAIIMDNLSVHKTKSLIESYVKKKMNVIFNCPYLSIFNSIELAFRNLKQFLYSKLYENMDDVIVEASSYLESIKFKNSLKLNFKETLEKYISFSEKYKQLNLNNLY